MLRNAMAAFDNVILHPSETVADLTPRELIGIIRRHGLPGQAARIYVTKRGGSWHEPARVDALIAHARRQPTGIVQIVRDPRDVLLSRHRKTGDRPYVSVAQWVRSIAAGRAIESRLPAGSAFMTVRYEDVVHDPRRVERALGHAFALALRPGARIDRVADSLAAAGPDVWDRVARAGGAIPAADTQRNADGRSIGKWRGHPDNPEALLLADPAAAALYPGFMARHGYERLRETVPA
jgi:hypothetical protein